MLVATLVPADHYGLARGAFCSIYNKGRYVAPRDDMEFAEFSSRETTPESDELIKERSDPYELTHRLTLRLDNPVKDPAKGFCFGANPEVCDIVLGSQPQGICNTHFYLTFGNVNGVRRLILKDVSTNGTAVAYSGQGGFQVRQRIWLLDLTKEEGRWEVEVRVEKLRFMVLLATHRTCHEQYAKNIEMFLPGKPALSRHAIFPPPEPASPALGFRPPMYVSERELGRGAFGSVEKVINVGTGEIYARKTFFQPPSGRSANREAQLKEEWLQLVRREIRILKENSHVSRTTSFENGCSLIIIEGKHCPGRRLLRGLSTLPGDAILSSWEP